MTRVQSLRRALLEWFDKHKRDLPWRRTQDPYAIWLSEVMLQQTQVVTVVPYWHRFLKRFPTVQSLADAALPDVLALWRGLGYYSRARHLHRAAQLIRARRDGFPTTVKELARLPGFGRYTAGAVSSIAFGEPAPVVDGNVARVLSRLFEVDGAPGDRRREKELWSIAEELVAGDRPGDLNQALMELGALICRVDEPACLLCPVRAQCAALRSGRVAEIPPLRPRPSRKELTLAVAVWRRGDKLLLGRRHEKGLFGGLWELPTGEMRPRSASTNPLAILRQAVGAEIQVIESIGMVRRALTHRDLRLHLYRVKGSTSPKRSPDYEELRWFSEKEAEGLGMSAAMEHALRLLSSSAGVRTSA